MAVLLDPPKNVTVSNTGHAGQLNVSWVPPSLKYMDDSMIYEVLYAPADSHAAQVSSDFTGPHFEEFTLYASSCLLKRKIIFIAGGGDTSLL